LHHARVYLKELQTKSQKNPFDFRMECKDNKGFSE